MGEAMTLLQFCSNIRSIIDSYAAPQWVQAEIAQVTGSRGTHYYMELVQKSEENDNPVAKLRCNMWARQAMSIVPNFEETTGSRLAAGMKVLCYIMPTFHEVYGLSGNIMMIDPSFTLGEVEARRRAIVKQLEADGVIDMNKELELPSLIKKIAVISAQGAAGYGDFCAQLRGAGLNIGYTVDLYEAAMQGVDAERSVTEALARIDGSGKDYDVVVIIRGGGSRLDLACFDSYVMASSVAQFPLPVIAGIGHDRDHSVVDMVAHTALKTPTAVAEFITDHNTELIASIEELSGRLVQAVGLRMAAAKAELGRLKSVLGTIARSQGQMARARVETNIERLRTAAANRIESERGKVERHEGKVEALDPQRVLGRGYSITTDKEGRRLRSVKEVAKGDEIRTYLSDGEVDARVI